MTAMDEMIEQDSNGWVLVAVLQKSRLKRDGSRSVQTWTWSHGPFASKREAVRGADRLRRSLQRDIKAGGTPIEILTVTSRPLWRADEIGKHEGRGG